MIFLLTNISNGTNEIIEVQKNSTGIPAFLTQSNEYIQKNFPDIDLKNLFESSVQGKLNIPGIWGIIVELFGDELILRNFKYDYSFNNNCDT